MVQRKLRGVLESVSADRRSDTHTLEAVLRSADRSPIDSAALRALVGDEIESRTGTAVTWTPQEAEHERFRYAPAAESIDCTLDIYRAEDLLDRDEYQRRWQRPEGTTDCGMARLGLETGDASIVDAVAAALRERDGYRTDVRQYS